MFPASIELFIKRCLILHIGASCTFIFVQFSKVPAALMLGQKQQGDAIKVTLKTELSVKSRQRFIFSQKGNQKKGYRKGITEN